MTAIISMTTLKESSTEGFKHESGYRYAIRMDRYNEWPDLEEPSQDASRCSYRLTAILGRVQET